MDSVRGGYRAIGRGAIRPSLAPCQLWYAMPEISRFFGIVVYLNWRDHNPPHVHALYGGHEALVSLDGAVLAGQRERAYRNHR